MMCVLNITSFFVSDDTNKATSHGDPFNPKFYFQTQPVYFSLSKEMRNVSTGVSFDSDL